MNKKIEELMGKTLDAKFSHTWTALNYEDLGIFSEHLIESVVRECANVAHTCIDDEWFDVGGAILDHFGVKK
jgi:hypothetical protein